MDWLICAMWLPLTEAAGDYHDVVGPETGEDEPVIDLESCFDPAPGEESQSHGDRLDDSASDADNQYGMPSAVDWWLHCVSEQTGCSSLSLWRSMAGL